MHKVDLADLYREMRFGIRFPVRWSLIVIVGLSTFALAIGQLTAGQPSLWLLMAYIMTAFFGVGILFGNQNALVIEPLGHLAGLGAAVVGSLSTPISMPQNNLLSSGRWNPGVSAVLCLHCCQKYDILCHQNNRQLMPTSTGPQWMTIELVRWRCSGETVGPSTGR
jgi:hypothetical protein